ncbi:exodeoxyribonuclease VII small subunit [Neolewinella aurantiaca]|uniref:Exodeoxyribonuclease VII small subunit n=1 Tax=Neolewinella aurantiaca TaxID=2602767 RepID=A0A5C7FMP3_9BACT|nr:exodeoxyribonuclease VII small subunit [Neolewinella aurantiaca]TXF91402.1 exodeoxyribonuclease VII small subunit [Neolewinella aurantiaca]
MTYQEAITELESLLVKLQEVPADIDQLHARVARAEVLVATCRAQLRGVEEALNKLDKTTGE